jgi:hypothetical protein
MKQNLLGKSRIKQAFICVIVVFLLYTTAEVVHRAQKYDEIMGAYTSFGFSYTEAPLFILDEQTGYTYNPNSQLRWRYYNESDQVTMESEVKINNLGMLSTNDVIVDKPDLEFRIACLGDSFTATPSNKVQWPAALEEFLDQDDALKQAIGKTAFRTLNLALDGTGLDQILTVYEHKAKPLSPDMVIINFTSNSPYYKFVYRDTIKMDSALGEYWITVASPSLPVTLENPGCLYSKVIVADADLIRDPQKLTAIKREIYDRMVDKLPWYSPYPDLAVSLLGGRFGLNSRLESTWTKTVENFSTQEEAITNSLAVLRNLASLHPNVLILNPPLVQECHAGEPRPVIREMIARAADLEIETMIEHMPLEASEEEINGWYNLPHDQHPSDAGYSLYAQKVHERIRARLMGSEGKDGGGQPIVRSQREPEDASVSPSSLTFEELDKRIQQDISEEQVDQCSHELVGTRVLWSGVIKDIDKNNTVHVAVGGIKSNLQFHLANDQLNFVEQDQNITFTGIIERVYIAKTFPPIPITHVGLKDVRITPSK